jgi:hypothetical protein
LDVIRVTLTGLPSGAEAEAEDAAEDAAFTGSTTFLQPKG